MMNNPLNAKYLGVIIQSNLMVHMHIQTKTTKTKQQQGMTK